MKKKIGTVLVMAFSAGIGWACGYLAMRYMDRIFGDGLGFGPMCLLFGTLLLGIYAAVFVQLILHEAGHLVFGLLSGYRFSSFRIGSLMWVKQDGVLHFRRLSIAGTGGQCLMAPPDLVDGRIPVTLYNLGGAMMNLIASGVFFALYWAAAPDSLVSLTFCVLAIVGVMTALMNGVPLHLGTVDNDGYNALSLRRDPEAQRAFWVQLEVNARTAEGVRLRDMDDMWFQIPSDAAMKNSMVAAVGVLACSRLMDEHRFDEAERQMARFLALDSGIVGLHRGLMICDRIYTELITQNRPEALNALRTKAQEKFMKSMKGYPSVIRTEYAWALLGERNREQAEKYKELFEKRAKSYPYPSEIQSERELMEIAKAAL